MISRRRIGELLSAFPYQRILVAGDFILDRYLFGRVERISPEAPVPVLHVQSEENRPGGAGNVAANITSLGGNVILMGVVGDDDPGRSLRTLTPGNDLIVTDPGFPTITKTRVMSQRQQIVRIDREVRDSQPSTLAVKTLLEKMVGLSVDGVLVSDYAKGTVSPDLMQGLKELCPPGGPPLIVDPKPANISLYKGVTGITPNLAESEAILGDKISGDLETSRAARRLLRRFRCRFVAITRGEEGITAAEIRKKAFHVPARSREVYDVTGAGDTVAAALILALSAGASLRESVTVANAAASLVVEKVGTARVSPDELAKRLNQRRLSSGR